MGLTSADILIDLATIVIGLVVATLILRGKL